MCIFLKSIEEIQLSLKTEKNNGYITSRSIRVCVISLTSTYNENILDKSFKENQDTQHIHIKFFGNRAAFQKKIGEKMYSRTREG